MQKYISYTLLSLLGFALVSCEKVLDIDLNESDSKLVVIADLQTNSGEITVDLSRTTSYFAAESPERVTGAVVELETNSGTIAVPHIANGLYSANVNPQVGETLTLRVQDGSNSYSAASTVPGIVQLDSLIPEFQDPNAFFDGGYVLRANWLDPAGIENFYRYRIWLGDSLYDDPSDLSVTRDDLYDGQTVDFPLFPNFFQTGDSVRLEFRTITEAMYDYYETLSDITVNQGGGSTAAPANPNSNVEGGALGYFNVYASDLRGLIIP